MDAPMEGSRAAPARFRRLDPPKRTSSALEAFVPWD